MNASPTPAGQFSLTGPSGKISTTHLPVRGDLAHIGLAGRFFVPHYAVPIMYRVRDHDAPLRAQPAQDAEMLAEMAAGTPFELLDMQGIWAWGALGLDGPAGYVLLAQLERVDDIGKE